MKKTNDLYCITAGNPKKLIKPVVWTVLADLGNLFPCIGGRKYLPVFRRDERNA